MKTIHQVSTSTLATLAITIAAVGCGASDSETPIGSPRESTGGLSGTAEASTDDVRQLVADETAFAVDMYGELRKIAKDGNILYSPHSISAALSMTYAGARGSTATAIAKTLRLTKPESLHSALSKLTASIAPVKAPKGPVLNITNRLFGDNSLQPTQAFSDLLDRNYKAPMQRVDFRSSSEQARSTINNWVSGVTEHHIEDLMPSGSIDGSTRLVLVNAVYFLANWMTPFLSEKTSDSTFTRANGAKTTVKTMSEIFTLDSYYETDSFQSLRLPYTNGLLNGAADGSFELAIALPAVGKLAQFESELTPERIAGITKSTSESAVSVQVRLPKFKVQGDSVPLKDALTNLGMGEAFSDFADFSGITPNSLTLNNAFHQAMIKVDELGTEAAAATGVGSNESISVPPANLIEFNVNRPFFIFLREAKTGLVLFMGRVSEIK